VSYCPRRDHRNSIFFSCVAWARHQAAASTLPIDRRDGLAPRRQPKGATKKKTFSWAMRAARERRSISYWATARALPLVPSSPPMPCHCAVGGGARIPPPSQGIGWGGGRGRIVHNTTTETAFLFFFFFTTHPQHSNLLVLFGTPSSRGVLLAHRSKGWLALNGNPRHEKKKTTG